jgi:hypothetical protein
MTQHPRWIERLAAALVPPASEEHVLGDIAETSRTPRQYVRNLLSILPHVVWTQVRRRATPGGIVFNGIVSGIAFLVSLGPEAVFFDSAYGPLRLLAVWATWIAGCALSAAYGPRDKPIASNIWLFSATVAATLAMAALQNVPVVSIAIAIAALIAISLVFAMPFLKQKAPPPLSLESVADHARLFQRVVWWRNVREAAAALFVVGANTNDLYQGENAIATAARLLLIAGTLFIMWYLFARAGTRPVPDTVDADAVLRFHRGELTRQRDILRAVPLWYLLPFAPGFIALALSNWSSQGPAVLLGLLGVLVLCTVVWLLNVWAARSLQKQIADLDAIPATE